MKETVAGESNPPGPGVNRAGLGIFGYDLSCGEVWGHTGQFPGYRAFGAATPDGRDALAMMVNATETSEQANEAVVHAQQLAACRALGITGMSESTTLDGPLAPSGGPPLVLAAVLAAALLIGASAPSYAVLGRRT